MAGASFFTMSEPAIALEQCPEKHAITVEITDVIASLLKLTNEELAAVIDGDFTRGESIHGQLRVLREWKDVLMDRLRVHVANHGC